MRTGTLSLGFADRLSKTAACVSIGRFLRHLRAMGMDPRSVAVQTDNGSEFDGTWIDSSP